MTEWSHILLNMGQVEIFKALGDASRRKLLDLLFERDGQSLSELEANLEMTRFGVMKHLRILESARLITTQKVGREKLHYLNPVPIQLVYDRWVSKYARGFTSAMTNLKYKLEENTMEEKYRHVFEIYIQTTPERLWQAITDGEMTRQYYFGTSVKSDWKKGSAIEYFGRDNNLMVAGEILEIEPTKKLITTFARRWDKEAENETPSRVAFEIEQMGDSCKLTLIHDEIESQLVSQEVSGGWSQILSGLKTLLETGQPLVISKAA